MERIEALSFTPVEVELLFSIARKSIHSRLFEGSNYSFDEQLFPGKVMIPMGAFVTIKVDGTLRGCIGRFLSEIPLYKAVAESAISSAFQDPRFDQVTKEEYHSINLEITVLGPLIKIDDINEIVLGRHGIYLKKGTHTGTMLPQVATENGWNVEDFLGYTSKNKAGIGWDGWRDAEIFIYEGVVLEEK